MSEEPAGSPDRGAARGALADELRAGAQALAEEVADRHLQSHPELVARHGALAAVRCREDGVFHIGHLAAALATDRPQLFDDYVTWLRALLDGHGTGHDGIAQHLNTLVTVIGETFGSDARAATAALVARGLSTAEPSPSVHASHLPDDTPLGVLASAYLDRLLARDRHGALALVQEAADDGVDVAELYLQVFAPVLREVGLLWQSREVTVGQEHLVTAATQLAMAQLYPRMFATPGKDETVVVAAVGGELHEVGARMVADLFELDGWDSHFLGANTPTSAIIETVEQVQADVLALSVTLPPHVSIVGDLIGRCRRRCPDTWILAGGRPFSMVPDLWEQVGADGTAADARQAVQVATDLVGAS